MWCCLALLLMVAGPQTAGGTIPNPLVVQPALFGKSWGNATMNATIHVVNIDLCNETLINTAETEASSSSENTTSSHYHTVLLFDAVEWNSACTYPDMAQAAEKAFPFADCLLISRVDFVGMAQGPGELDTSLHMATITIDDTLAIKRGLNDSTFNLTTDGLWLAIDAVSRSLVDVCHCDQDKNDDPLNTWSLFLRISSTLSLMGSSYIIWSLASTTKKRSENLKLLFNRLLIALCVCDILSSFGMFIGRWAFSSHPPGDYEGYYSEELWQMLRPGAVGTKNTCVAEGFVIHLGLIGGALFASFLAIQTLLYVKYGWRYEKMKKAERVFFLVGIGVPLIGACTGVYLNLFNEFDLGICWLTKPVKRCEYVVDDDEDPGGSLLDEWCEDVYNIIDKPFLLQLGLGLIWSLVALCICVYSMMSLFFFVRRQETRSARWVLTASSGNHQNVVLTRAFLYLLVFVLVWFPSIVALALKTDALTYVITTLTPLQGCLNAMISSGYVEKCFFKKRTSSENFERSSSNYEVPSKEQKGTKHFKVLTKIGSDDVIDDGT